MGVRKAFFGALGAASLGVAAVGGFPAPAGAAPEKELLHIECDALGSFDINVNGNGAFSPGRVIGSTQVGLPYKIHVEGTFTPTTGDPIPILEDAEHPAPRNGRTDHCTWDDAGSNSFGSFEIHGEVWITYTPG